MKPHPMPFNYLPNRPNYKFLDWPKLKAFAHNKLNLAEKKKFVLGRVKNIVVTSTFPFSHNVFKKTSFQGSLRVSIVCKELVNYSKSV